MANRTPFEVGEWYHCYNRGVDKRRVFENARDYERFLLLLYIANGTIPLHLSNLREQRLGIILDKPLERGEPLVEIGAYCLMPNHAHLVLKEVRAQGIARFMQKVFTGYTMYFNKKRERSGALFAGAFKSKHVHNDRYLQRLLAYVHLNPIELIEPDWKQGKGDIRRIRTVCEKYDYSSLPDFLGTQRVHRKILGSEIFELQNMLPLTRILEEARAYYQDFPAAR